MEEEFDEGEEGEEGNIVMDLVRHVLPGGRIFNLISSVIPKKRQCFTRILNATSEYILRDPSVYTDTGRCTKPLSPTIQPSCTGEALFTKTQLSLRGSGGVFTYDLYNTDTETSTEKMAVMYKVPLDLNLRSVEYAVGVMDKATKCNKKLFDEMYKKTKPTFIRGKAKDSSLTYKSGRLTIRATMSDTGSSVMEIEVRNS